jgi:uncharacterized repeat protein (TIGR01451 family)
VLPTLVRRALAAGVGAGVLGATLVVTAPPAAAAPALTLRPLTWNVIGLDSNRPGTGPDTFPVGARICNTGDSAAADVRSALVFDSANAHISADGPTELVLGELAAGACVDAYYNVVISRTSAAFGTTRRYRITAGAQDHVEISTPADRELYVERLVSQNRNSVTSLTGSGLTTAPTSTAPGTAALVVGSTYTFRVEGATAPGGYEQLQSFLTLPTALFRVLSTSATYSTPTGATNDTLYADACGWDANIGPRRPKGTYLSCVGPVQYASGKAGGTISIEYTVEVVRAGTGVLSTMIYDFSGASYHYNGDFGANLTTVRVTAVDPPQAPDLALAKSHDGDLQRGTPGTYALTVSNVGTGPTTGPITVVDTLPEGMTLVSSADGGWTCTASGRTVTCTDPRPLAAGAERTLALTVLPGPLTATQVVNTATVSTAGDASADNDTATDPTYVNSPPVAVDDVRSTPFDTAVTLDPRANDTDPDAGTSLTISAAGPASHGAVVCSATACTWTPPPGFTGTATFPYTVDDGHGGTATATVTRCRWHRTTRRRCCPVGRWRWTWSPTTGRARGRRR